MVQFQHRLLAYVLCVFVLFVWWRGREAGASGGLRWALHGLLGALALQVTLGIATLLWVVPIPLAAAHQAGALLVLTAALIVAAMLQPADSSAMSGERSAIVS